MPQCVSCSEPSAEGSHRCTEHRDAHRAAQRTFKDRRRLAGLCLRCGRVSVERFQRCGQCRELEAEYKRAAYARR